MNGVAGLEVAPVGNPESVTETSSMKPFSPAIETENIGLPPPEKVSIWLGDKLRVKSFAGLTTNARLAKCVRGPLAPWSTTVNLPVAADAGTDKDTVWLCPAVTENGEAGETAAPVGNPDIAITTELVNPFCPVIDTLNAELLPPASAVIALGEREILKSCGGIRLEFG
jgi:hypothetical protein